MAKHGASVLSIQPKNMSELKQLLKKVKGIKQTV